jgi:hypothetical protein
MSNSAWLGSERCVQIVSKIMALYYVEVSRYKNEKGVNREREVARDDSS